MASITDLENRVKFPGRSCRVCDWMHDNLALWVDIHERALMNNYSATSIADTINTQLADLLTAGKISEEQAKPISPSSLRNHFNRHCATVEIFQRLLKSALNIQSAKSRDESTIVAHQEIRDKFGLIWDAVDEFVQLREIVQAAEMRIAQYDARLREMENAVGYVTDFKSIKEYQQLVSQHLTDRQSLLKLQNSMEVAGKAVEAAIAVVSKAFINEAASVADEAQGLVNREHPGSIASAEVGNLVRVRLGDSLKAIVQDAHTVILKQYGIK